jgi:hypothetical protein
VCDPITFCTKYISFFNENDDIYLKKGDVQFVQFVKDRMILGDYDYMKHDYLFDINLVNSNVIHLRYFADFDVHSKSIYVSDALTTVIIHLALPNGRKFLDKLLWYLNNYKKYDMNDKSIKKFNSFKNIEHLLL